MILALETTEWFARGVLLAIAGAALAMVLLRARRSGFNVPQYLLYTSAQLVGRIWWRAEFRGTLSNLPRGQGAVIVCNHRSFVDPIIIQIASDRAVHWLVAREYDKHPVLHWFFRIPECIPVGRGGIDTAAAKLAIRYARQGDLVGIFPEGRINLTDQLLLPGRPGAALIARKAGVPLIPCYIEGSPMKGSILRTLLTPGKIRLTVGEPIELGSLSPGRETERSSLEATTKRLLVEIARLAGRNDFEPQLAGRQGKPPGGPKTN